MENQTIPVNGDNNQPKAATPVPASQGPVIQSFAAPETVPVQVNNAPPSEPSIAVSPVPAVASEPEVAAPLPDLSGLIKETPKIDPTSFQSLRKKGLNWRLLAPGIAIAALVLIGAYYTLAGRNSSSTITNNELNLVTTAETNTVDNTETNVTNSLAATNKLSHSNKEGGYSFEYPDGWKLGSEGSTAWIYNPNGSYGPYVPGDAAVFITPYTSMTVAEGVTVTNSTVDTTKSHDQQAQDLAKQIDANYKPIKLAGLSGYSAVVVNQIGTTNIFLVGNFEMISLQFFGAAGVEHLSAGQKVLYDTLALDKTN